jgi:hypothetical protein
MPTPKQKSRLLTSLYSDNLHFGCDECKYKMNPSNNVGASLPQSARPILCNNVASSTYNQDTSKISRCAKIVIIP